MTINEHAGHAAPTGKKTAGRSFRRLSLPGAAFLLLTCFLAWRPALVLATTHAAQELSAFAGSRQGVGTVINESKEVHAFLLKAFTGLYTSVPLAWDPREPNDNAYAEHKPSLNRKLINIRVSSKLNPLDQVACMVYEAINAQNEKEFAKLTDEAHSGDLTKTEFIDSILRLEHKSLKKTREFLSSHEPFKGADISKTVFYSKMNGTPEEFDAFIEYLHAIKRDDYDVFKHYSDFYDFIIPPTKRWKAREKEQLAADKGNGNPEHDGAAEQAEQ